MKALLHPCVSVLMEMGDVSFPDLQVLLDDERNEEILARAQATRAFRQYRDFFDYQFHQTDFATTKRAISRKTKVSLITGRFTI